MHNTYISSTIHSLRSNGSHSFFFNDYPYFLNERFDRNPSRISPPCCCACCSCCILSTQRVQFASYLCGLRQSTLLQRSAYRKLILGVGDRYYKRNPSYGFDRGCYEVSSTFKERSVCSTSRRGRKERLCCMVEEKNDEIYDSEHLVEAEELLSLLSEEVDEEYVGGGVRRSNQMPCRRMEVERKGSLSGQERNRSSLEKVRVERREKYGSRCDSRKKNNAGLRLVDSNSKADSVRVETKNESLGSQEKNVSSSERIQVETCGSYGCNDDSEKKTKGGLIWAASNSNAESELVGVESSEEDSRWNERRGALTTRSDGLRERNASSSCSSYYSFSSADFDGEIDVHNKHGQLIEESLTGYKDSRVTGRGRFDGQLEEYKNHRDDLEVHGEASEQRKTTAMTHKDVVELHGEVLEQRKTTAGVCLDWDLRKKSEKKLNDVSTEEIRSARGSSQMHTRVLQSHENNHGKASISYKNFNVEKDKRTSSTNLDKSANKQHSQKGDKVEKTVNVVGETRGQHLNTQHLREMSEVQDFVTERTSFRQNHSDTAMTNRQENINIVDLDHQTGQYIIGEPNLRSQQSAHISEIGDRYAENISIMHSEMNRKNHVQNKNLVSVSSPESTKPHPQKVQNSPQKFQSITGSSDVTDISLVHATDAERYHYCLDTISAGKTFPQATESTQSNERLNKLSPTNEDEKSRRVSRFVGRDSEEAFTSSASSGMVTLSNVKDINVHEEAGRRSDAWLVPPLSQIVARSSLHVESVGEITSQEVSNTSVESDSRSLNVNSRVPQTSLHHQSDIGNGRGETHEEYSYLITPEDTLASADRFQKSSTQFVGEFFEKVRNETTTSEIEKAESMSETKMAFGDEKYSEKTSNQYASENLQLEEHHKRLSSGGSGAKGPSDEMWDVTDPSILGTPGEEEIEASTDSGKTIGRKTGRSLWSIVADLARLRWGSRPETPSSAARLGARASPNESFSSGAYSSAREIEENKNTLARDKSLQLATESDKLLQRKLSSHSQGQGSDKVRSTNERETETLSSTSIAESGSASKGISLSSGDETLVCNEDVIGFHGTPSDTKIVESQVPPIDRGKRPAIVTEIPKVVKSGVSRSGLGEQMEQSGRAKVNEVSGTEGKDGELKRRKLQRIPQFHQDRFDDWEEAYKLENEQRRIDEMFMREALLEAKKAADYWEVPVGAVLVQNGNIIARGYNLVEELRDSTAHAEMMCIREASNVLRSWRLAGTALYVTLEPCPMCAGAILQARIDTVVWGAPNKLLGADGSWIRLFPDGDERGNISELSEKPAPPPHPFHPKLNIRRGVMASECADTMRQFFQLRRKKKTKQEETTQPSSSTVITSHHQSKFLGKLHDMFHLLFCL